MIILLRALQNEFIMFCPSSKLKTWRTISEKNCKEKIKFQDDQPIKKFLDEIGF